VTAVSGRAFLSLQREAKTAGRTTAEYLRLYALEGFLLRLAHSPRRNRFVLKGGVLLAAYGLRRPTTDIDGVALQTSNEVEDIRQFVVAVASTALPAELDDGLTFDLDNVTAEALQRGSASTRWRDFGDIFVITGLLTFRAGEVRQALQSVADYRHVELASLDDALDGYAEIGQPRWASWRRKLQLTETLPERFDHTLESLKDFADPIITGTITDPATWDPIRRVWNRAS